VQARRNGSAAITKIGSPLLERALGRAASEQAELVVTVPCDAKQ
jgi:hypothetical protein